MEKFFIFLNCYLAAPRPTLSNYQGGSLTHHIVCTTRCISLRFHFQPEGHWEPRKGVGSLSPAEHLITTEPSDSDHNALTH